MSDFGYQLSIEEGRGADAPPEEAAPSAMSVSAAMSLAKGALEGVTVRLIGEVSELSNKRGYKAVYFTVKDESAALPCMIWNNRYAASGVELKIGSLVELRGRFTLYAPKGRMNFDVFEISLAGEGNLRAQVANLARKLSAEGLMDPVRKKPVPEFPQKIGVVTSPRGAAVHDVLRTLRRRFPVAEVYVAGVPVEGAGAAQNVIEGMRAVYRAGVDVILVVRGGGSFEDLMPFNDEALARAISACPTPVVTGIGHEPDNSIADMVADVRCSTPTAAAEAVSPARDSLDARLASCGRSLAAAMGRRLEREGSRVARMADRPVFSDSAYLLSTEMQALDYVREKLARALPEGVSRNARDLAQAQASLERLLRGALVPHEIALQTRQERIAATTPAFKTRFVGELGMRAARLEDLSPVKVMARGWSVTRDSEGAVVRSVDQVSSGESVRVQVTDGVLSCTVDEVNRVDSAVFEWEASNE